MCFREWYPSNACVRSVYDKKGVGAECVRVVHRLACCEVFGACATVSCATGRVFAVAKKNEVAVVCVPRDANMVLMCQKFNQR